MVNINDEVGADDVTGSDKIAEAREKTIKGPAAVSLGDKLRDNYLVVVVDSGGDIKNWAGTHIKYLNLDDTSH